MKQFPVFRMFIFTTCLLQAISPLCTTLLWSQTNAEPIIDMHLRAKHAGELGPPPLYICSPFPCGRSETLSKIRMPGLPVCRENQPVLLFCAPERATKI